MNLKNVQTYRKEGKNKGFTLIEAIVVMAVITILILIAAPKMLDKKQKAQETRDIHAAKVLETAMDQFLVQEKNIADYLDSANTDDIKSSISNNKLIGSTGYVKEFIDDKYYSVTSEFIKDELNVKYDYSDKSPVYTDENGKIFIHSNTTSKDSPNIPIACLTPDEQDYTFDSESGTIISYNGTLTSVVIPESFNIDGECVPVLKIGNNAFANKNLDFVTIPSGVAEIGDSAFKNNNLTEIVIPDSVSGIGKDAFIDNPITAITVNPNLPISDAFDLSNIKTIIVPDGTKVVQGDAYKDLCAENLILPDGLERIEAYAFANHRLKAVNLPSSLIYIGEYAFSNNAIDGQRTIESITFNGVEYIEKIDKNGNIAEGGTVLTQINALELSNSIFFIETPQAFNPSGIAQIVSGNGFFAALINDGTVWVWGGSPGGATGIFANSTMSGSLVPVKINGLSDVAEIAAGQSHILARKTNGKIVAWGSNNNSGQIGNGSIYYGEELNDVNRDIDIKDFSSISRVMAGGNTSFALKEDGSLWGWGANYDRQLLDGTNVIKTRPIKIEEVTNVKDLVAGEGYALVLHQDNTVSSWGDNYFGQLGNGTKVTESTNPVKTNLTNVKQVAINTYRNIDGIDTSYALKYDGTVWAWGRNYVTLPSQILGLENIQSISIGIDHGLALKNDGTVWTWGTRASGELGDGATYLTRNNIPSKIPELNNVTQVFAGLSASIAVKKDGSIWAWGDNTNGQLGDGTNILRAVPTQIAVNIPINATSKPDGVVKIAAGSNFTVALKSDGTVRMWGGNDSGLYVNNGKTKNSTTPFMISHLRAIRDVSAGVTHILALRADNSILSWGRNNSSGQYGNASTNGSSVLDTVYWNPKKPTSLIKSVVAGGSSSFAILEDNTVWGWGSNNNRQLQNGTSTNQTRAISTTISNPLNIAVGEDFVLKLNSDKTVSAWGYNNQGQLGNGTNKGSITPVPVTGLDNVKMVKTNLYSVHSSSEAWSAALKEDGTVWAWGTSYGKTPTQIIGLSDVKSISVGLFHGIAVKNDGTVWTWGRNDVGQLGNENITIIANLTATQVPGLSNIRDVAAGSKSSFAINQVGDVWAWGGNPNGELGDGTTVSKTHPVKIKVD